MEKIKGFLKNKGESIKQLLKTYPVTLVLTIIITICGIVLVENYSDEFIKNNIGTMLIAVFGIFFVETYFKKISIKVIGFIVFGVIAFFINNFLMLSEKLTNLQKELQEDVIRILIGYLVILVLLSIYKLYKKSGLKFEKYMLEIAKNVIANGIIYIILNIGLMLIVGLFTMLILDVNIIFHCQILLLGLFLVPSMLQAISDTKKEKDNNFIKNLIIYVLVPLVTIAMLIIYAYIAKIFINNEVPSNVIFSLLTTLFIIAFPIWLLASNYEEENKIIGRIIKLLPIAFIPFIFLEIYSIWARVSEFGITPSRYFGIAFIIFQIVVLFFNIYKKREKLKYILFAGIGILIVTNILPITNYENVSKMSQKNRLVKYFEEGKEFINLTEEEKNNIRGPYRYLINKPDEEKYIPQYILNQKEDINFNNSLSDSKARNYISYTDKNKVIDVSEYKSFLEVRTNYYKITNTNPKEFVIKYFDEEIILDMEELFNILINKEDENLINEYLDNNNKIIIDENKDLYITSLNFSYTVESKLINRINLNGYILEK